MKVLCVKCGTELNFDIKPAVIHNYKTFSIACIEHQGEVACVCGTIWVVGAVKVDVALGLFEVTVDQRDKLVIPAGGVTH